MIMSVLTTVHSIARRLSQAREGYREGCFEEGYDVHYNQAWLILEHVTGKSKEQLIIEQSIALDPSFKQALDDILNKIIEQHMPLPYITGSVAFMNLDLAIRPPVLIPRPETEEWCAAMVRMLTTHVESVVYDRPLSVLDLCTGSGCIALAIASHVKDVHVVAVDNAPHALELAHYNARKNMIDNCTFVSSDLYASLGDTRHFDVIVSNPPYVRPSEFSTLDPCILRWEDLNALVARDNGLAIIKRIVQQAPTYLDPTSPCCQLWCEIGYTQAQEVTTFFEDAGFGAIVVMNDLNNKNRVVCGRYQKRAVHA